MTFEIKRYLILIILIIWTIIFKEAYILQKKYPPNNSNSHGSIHFYVGHHAY